MSGILVFLLLALASLQVGAVTRPKSALQQQTQRTLETLSSSPCSQDLTEVVLAAQKKLPGEVFYCSISSIVIELAEVLVDTFFFGFEAYEEVPALWDDLKALKGCLSETSLESLLTCALEYVPGTVQAVEVVVSGLENYVGEMQMIVPLLVSEIKQCRESSEQRFRSLLKTTLDQSRACA